MCIAQTRQCMIVIPFYQYMCRLPVIIMYSKFWHLFKNRNLILTFLFKGFWHINPCKTETLLFQLCFQSLHLLLQFSHLQCQFFLSLLHLCKLFSLQSAFAPQTIT